MSRKLEVPPLNIFVYSTHAEKAETAPALTLQSLLGNQLHKIHYIAASATRIDCFFQKICPYFYLLESRIEKANPFLRGKEYRFHSLRLLFRAEQEISFQELSFKIELFRKAIQYGPNILHSITEADKDSLLNQGASFMLTVAASGKDSKTTKSLKFGNQNNIYQLALAEKPELVKQFFSIFCRTPLRLKTASRYASKISLCVSLCNKKSKNLMTIPNVAIPEKKLLWKDYSHYTAQQITPIQSGSRIGNFVLEGIAPRWVWQTNYAA